WVQSLYGQYRYPRMAVVAHSMGGLVARAFVNRVIAANDGRAEGIRLFLTMSTPWDGHAAAQSGVTRAPVVAPAWYDMAPGSPFQRSLLDTTLPLTLGHDLLFSYAGTSRRMREANDGTVTVASQLEPRVQSRARIVRGYNETHTSILESVEVAALLNQELVATTGEEGLSPGGGRPELAKPRGASRVAGQRRAALGYRAAGSVRRSRAPVADGRREDSGAIDD